MDLTAILTSLYSCKIKSENNRDILYKDEKFRGMVI